MQTKQETIQSIIKWHAETFPDATLQGQAQKFQEEKKEYLAATNIGDKTEELADVFIVGCGIARFDMMFAAAVFSYVNQAHIKSMHKCLFKAYHQTYKLKSAKTVIQ